MGRTVVLVGLLLSPSAVSAQLSLSQITTDQNANARGLASASATVTNHQEYFDAFYKLAPGNPTVAEIPRSSDSTYDWAWKGSNQLVDTIPSPKAGTQERRDIWVGDRHFLLFGRPESSRAAGVSGSGGGWTATDGSVTTETS